MFVIPFLSQVYIVAMCLTSLVLTQTKVNVAEAAVIDIAEGVNV
jgi:hypothetical protein